MNNDMANYNRLKPVGVREESHPFCLERDACRGKKNAIGGDLQQSRGKVIRDGTNRSCTGSAVTRHSLEGEVGVEKRLIKI